MQSDSSQEQSPKCVPKAKGGPLDSSESSQESIGSLGSPEFEYPSQEQRPKCVPKAKWGPVATPELPCWSVRYQRAAALGRIARSEIRGEPGSEHDREFVRHYPRLEFPIRYWVIARACGCCHAGYSCDPEVAYRHLSVSRAQAEAGQFCSPVFEEFASRQETLQYWDEVWRGEHLHILPDLCDGVYAPCELR